MAVISHIYHTGQYQKTSKILDFSILICYNDCKSESDSGFLFGFTIKKRLILSLTTSLIILLSSAKLSQPAVTFSTPIVNAAVVEATTTETITETASTTTVLPIAPLQLESYVRSYFAKTPILAEVARCESQFRQFDTNGQVLRGKMVKSDVGIMQINKYYHEETAVKLGFNLETLQGNLDYALYLYNKQGLKPWSASEFCWGK